jgi:ankyrin repeat protein
MNEKEVFDEFVRECFDEKRVPDEELKRRVNDATFGSDGRLTMLQWAIKTRTGEALLVIAGRLLRQYGASVDIPDRGGDYTALVYATLLGKCECIRLLVEHGASLERCTIPNRLGFNACAIAWWYGKAEACCLLIDLGSSYTTISNSVRINGFWDANTRQVCAYISVVEARVQRARQACCALWCGLQGIPRDVRRLLMHAVWRQRRNTEW